MIITFNTKRLAEHCAKVALVVLLVDCCAGADNKQQVLKAPRSKPEQSGTRVQEQQAEEASRAQEEIRRQQELLEQQQPAPQAANPAEGSFVPDSDEYLIGVGLSDITGPSADINLMGYAKPNQDAGGIHLRQFSRSVVVEDAAGKRLVYTSIDNGMISQLLRLQVIEKLKQTYGDQMYNESNVMMSATHSHSCPGGFFQYMLYNIPSAGFISQTLEALLGGILRSVARAHENMRPAKIYFNEGKLLDASTNRSPTSYDNNPAQERANYAHNVDTSMYLLKMVDRRGQPMAVLNWFAVHGTSMNSSNHLISSDNKGYASLLLEQDFNPPGTLPGKGRFVAIFAQANEGDVSPNTRGARCVDSGLPCDLNTSTCGNPPRNAKCIASGPGKDMFESTKIIAYKQYAKARELMMDESSLQLIRGPLRFVHEYVDMTKQVVPLYKSVVDLAARQQPAPKIPINSTYSTCQAGLGYSFAAGTTDGPGAFDFQQGDTASSRYWNMVRDFLRRPSDQQMQCHHPKPILLSTGEMDFPYMWHPRIVPTQILMIGQLAIVGLPGEFTTMAGRRVRNVVSHALKHGATLQASDVLEDDDGDEGATLAADSNSPSDDDEELGDAQAGEQEPAASSLVKLTKAAKSESLNKQQLKRNKRAYSTANEIKVVLSGLSNIYTSYVTTLEEYEVQRYEGASTLYGPHTLQAYVNQFRRLALHLVTEKEIDSDQPQPPDLTSSLFTLKAGVIYDGAPHGRTFGSLLSDVNATKVYRCQESVSVSFVAGNPRNDLRQEDSFLYVDKFQPNGTSWNTVATDASWETKFIWERTNTFLGESRATIVWELPHDCQAGVYRIRHYGAHKNLLQTISQYSGQSSFFKVSNEDSQAQKALLDALMKAALDASQQAQLLNQKRYENDHDQANLDVGEAKSSLTSSLSHYSPLNFLSSLFNWNSNN